jgi:hypothetical protein
MYDPQISVSEICARTGPCIHMVTSVYLYVCGVYRILYTCECELCVCMYVCKYVCMCELCVYVMNIRMYECMNVCVYVLCNIYV